MKNLRKSEIVDYIQERYNPETMPEIYFKELSVLKDFSLRGLKLAAGERRKFGCYVCPKDKAKLVVFIPGKSTHYPVPAEVFFKFSDPYEIGDILRSKKRSRNAVIFTVGKYDYRYVPGICAFVRVDFFNKDFVLDKAVKNIVSGVKIWFVWRAFSAVATTTASFGIFVARGVIRFRIFQNLYRAVSGTYLSAAGYPDYHWSQFQNRRLERDNVQNDQRQAYRQLTWPYIKEKGSDFQNPFLVIRRF